ncbi:hypothetical protein [Neobacillus dielmonensis]|uniref:hypothetical protein n=1 Tax=Neobacillus dielmonensis TaxID=1347369 RepID=UPI0005AB513B|nr:hypothetical protein [Neobacillus dielmonensis]
MMSLLYVATIVIAGCIVFVPFFIIRKPIILKNKAEYYMALSELKQNPKNEELKLKVLELGRKFYGSARITSSATTFDESIINCEIIAACQTDEPINELD